MKELIRVPDTWHVATDLVNVFFSILIKKEIYFALT